MDAIEIEGERYLVIRKNDLDAIRDESFREGAAKQYTLDHPGCSRDFGKVHMQCVMANETVVINAHSDDNYRLVLDMKFAGLDDPVKLVLIVDSAYSMRDVLQEFIDNAELGGRHHE